MILVLMLGDYHRAKRAKEYKKEEVGSINEIGHHEEKSIRWQESLVWNPMSGSSSGGSILLLR